MTALVAALFLAVFSLDYLAVRLEVINRVFVLVPELLAAIAVVLMLGRGLILRQWEQPPKYVFVVLLFVLVCLIGIAAEGVAPGPVVAGIRNYFKFIPFFFLPAVYRFSDREIRILLLVMLCIVLAQIPLALYQRFFQFAHRMHTGDPIRGTASTSSMLSMVMAVSMAAFISLYVHARRGLWLTMFMIGLLLIPTTINETKGTALMVPLAMLGPVLFARGQAGRWRRMLPVLVICTGALAAFVAVYNQMSQARWQGQELQAFLDPDRIEHYVYRGARDAEDSRVGRLDSIILPMRTHKDDWIRSAFGLGIGNVSKSFLPGMDGKYYKRYSAAFGRTEIGNLLWETGVVGLAVFVFLLALIFLDALRVSANDATMAWLGSWWAAVIPIFMFGLFYKTVLSFNEIIYPMFFWSGIVAHRAWLSARETEEARSVPRIFTGEAPRRELGEDGMAGAFRA